MKQPQALIVEDEAIIAMMLQMFLEELVAAVQETASNVQDALRSASEGHFELGLPRRQFEWTESKMRFLGCWPNEKSLLPS